MEIVTGNDLIELISKGKNDAFAKFYTLYFQKLILISDNYVKDTYVAEGIVQDTFIKIWEAPQSLENVKSVKSYLYKSVINASLNYLSRQKNIVQHHEKIASEISEEYLQDLDEESELIVLLRREIDKLPKKCQIIFKMNRFDGLKYKEISEVLGISERTVENHIANALKTLRNSILTKNSEQNHSKIYNIFIQLYLF